ncbi:MAG: hypothetical protein Q4D33_13855, partial [Prevotellaceae bacterium]|nr:hypothetical protein [Prevotellaceae bacterium]
ITPENPAKNIGTRLYRMVVARLLRSAPPLRSSGQKKIRTENQRQIIKSKIIKSKMSLCHSISHSVFPS